MAESNFRPSVVRANHDFEVAYHHRRVLAQQYREFISLGVTGTRETARALCRGLQELESSGDHSDADGQRIIETTRRLLFTCAAVEIWHLDNTEQRQAFGAKAKKQAAQAIANARAL